MTIRTLSLPLALALATPLAAVAQESGEAAYEHGQLYQVATWNVDPADAGAWEAGVKQIVEAAEMAETPYRWVFWQHGSQYTLVFPIDNFAYFDDPMQFMRSFMGTAGETLIQEAMASFQTLNITVVAEEIAELESDWSYEAEGYDRSTTQYGHLDVMWLKPGMEDEFAELNKNWNAFFEDLGYPYPYDAHRVHFGDTGRIVYLTLFDDKAAYYGENDLMRLVEAKDMGERWQQLGEAFGATVRRWEHHDESLRWDMSYWPSPGGATH